jgi:UDP-N-acetylglucosamine--N-acetylmuramyl-(pentapeptide) pyrophosphoryl-undecaprenol N-acetylglucosamine transferase
MHQRANAEELEKAGAAVIVDDAKEAKINAVAIQKTLETLLYDHARRGRMAEAARRIGKPLAADAIASEILALMQRSSR